LRSTWLMLIPSEAAASSRVSANRGTACSGRRGPAFGTLSLGPTRFRSARPRRNGRERRTVNAASTTAAIIPLVGSKPPGLPSERGETWNDTEAINRHRSMTPSQRVALAIEASRAALLFANGKHVVPDDRDPIRP
jgi:hypothetical protein